MSDGTAVSRLCPDGEQEFTANDRTFAIFSHFNDGLLSSLAKVLCCQAGVFATGRSLVQRSHTDCGVSLCVI
jgi:hypothetical protein